MFAIKTRLILACLALGAGGAVASGCGDGDGDGSGSTDGSSAGAALEFSDPTTIDNPCAPLTEFDRCVMEGRSEGESERVVRTLLDETKPFQHRGETVEAAIIEDRAFVEGELVERTLDYFGQADDGTVHYFGEDVDNYENGRLADHSGSFLYGEHTDHLGVLMPGDPRVSDTWHFEKAPPITVERDTLLEKLPRREVGGTTYDDVLEIRELIDGEEVEIKYYAAGFGVIQELPPDGHVELVRCS